jgi:hypothetical protein
MKTRLKASASGIVCIFALMLLALGSAPAAAQTTALFIDIPPDTYQNGTTLTYVPPEATFGLDPGFDGAAYRFGLMVGSNSDPGDWWLLRLAAPGSAPLAVGTYGPTTSGGLTPFARLTVMGRDACVDGIGRFVVLEVVYAPDGGIARFAADVERHCYDGARSPVFAAIRYNSTIASLNPFGGAYPRYTLSITPPLHGIITGGVISCGGSHSVCSSTFAAVTAVVLSATPDPGYLFTGWTGACHGGSTITVTVNTVKECSATFDTVVPTKPRTLVLLDSAPGDYIGQGEDEVYSVTNSLVTAAEFSDNGVTLRIAGIGDRSDSYWELQFRAPGGARLEPGTYSPVSRRSFPTGNAVLNITGNSRMCDEVAGSFTVHEFTYESFSGAVVFAADFEQHCDSSTGVPLTGRVRVNSVVGESRPMVSLSASKLNFRIAVDYRDFSVRSLTPPQTVTIHQSVPGYLSWIATPRDPGVIRITPSSGTGVATFQVSYPHGSRAFFAETVIHVSFVGAANTVAPIAVKLTGVTIGTRSARAVRGDMDSDGAADLTLLGPDGMWKTRLFSSAFASGPDLPFGLSTDKPVPGDYDGDGRIDMAVYRPSNGIWYVIYSTTGALAQLQWGVATDIPMPDDYTGDGRTDLAVWRPSTGVWFIFDLATGTYTSRQWGVSTDVPLTGDYDADGKADVAVYRRSTGVWWVFFSSTQTYAPLQWGIATDIPVPADYTGDGRTDLAVYRPSNGHWFVFDLATGTYVPYQWGVSTDIPVPKDYDGDGRTDLAIWRPSTGTWFVYFLGTNNYISVAHGASGDVPIR